MPVNIGERLLVGVVPVDVAGMLGDSREAVGMNMAVAGMLGDSREAVGMNMAVAVRLDMDVPVVVDMNVLVDMPGVALLVVAMVAVDVAYPVVPVDMAEMLDIVVPTVADIDNRLGDGGFGMPASMLRNLLLHYHYAVTLVFLWGMSVELLVEYLHKLSPQ
ncbi:hypothetical protein NG798_27625 [Ancylothrix sp. C2]|uniref:hypothetical protein n=1 Tax=Ancylothrix sp. D3o TaxID=2953691 RepID=UPI0021BB1882|nr:hypothetical protein [Ancylothrix sp. D3o]MCT7953571.1 hypothetical protein [Ancylothrix sp. D3o]